MTRSIWLTDQGSDGMINEIFGFIKKLLGIGMPCAFHSLTGLYCPGCGGTRAVRELLYGDLRMSFQYHSLVLYGAAVVLLELVSWGASRMFLHLNRRLHIRRYNLFILIGAGIVVANWFYKNYMLVFRGVDLSPLCRSKV